MASAQVKMKMVDPVAAEARRWRNITLLLLAAALAGVGWVAWQNGMLGGLSAEQSTAAVTMPMGAMPPSVAGSTDESTVAVDGSTVTTDTVIAGATPALRPAGMMVLPDGAAPADSAQAVAEEAPVLSDSGLIPLQQEAATVQSAAATPIPAFTRRAGVSLLAGDGTIVATLPGGASLRAAARSADEKWLAVTTSAGSGWVQASQVIAYGLDGLALEEVPAAVVAAANTVEPAAAATGALPAPEGQTLLTALAAAQENAAPSAAAVLLDVTIATTGARLNVRSVPGTESAIIAKATSGEVYQATARSEAGDWLLLAQEGAAVGWVASTFVQLNGDAFALPVSTEVIDAPLPAEETTISQSAPALAAGVPASTAGSTGLTGKLVFQQSPGGLIYTYDLATGALRQLTYGFDPAISPDGTQVAFVREGGESGLYLINSDGTNERRIFARVALSSPKWSPDGGEIVFSRNDEYIECYQLGPSCLSPDYANDQFPPSVLAEMPLSKEYQHKLSVVDANGNNFHDLVALTSAKSPDWSAAGVIYQSSVGLQRTDDIEGATTQEVLYERLGPVYTDPDWQPNGDKIVFQIKGAAQYDLWLVNADGSGLVGITRPATVLVDSLPSNVAPAWSPDGAHIVFLSNRTDENTAGPWRLWVMDADGSNQRALPINVAIDYAYGLDQVVSWGG